MLLQIRDAVRIQRVADPERPPLRGSVVDGVDGDAEASQEQRPVPVAAADLDDVAAGRVGGGELLEEREGVVGGADAAVVVVEDGEDVVRVADAHGRGVWSGPFEVLAGPGPDVQVGIGVLGFELVREGERRVGSRRKEIGAEVGRDAHAERAFLGVGSEAG